MLDLASHPTLAPLRERVLTWHRRTEPWQGPVLLLVGGVWDYYTLRLERLLDNGLLFFYVVVFAAASVVDLRNPPAEHQGWRRWGLHLAGQFALGGLLSAYFVHYLRGAPLQRELTWLVLLGVLAVLTELRPALARRPEVRLPLLAFVAFHYVLAAAPLLTGQLLGPWVPLVAAGAMLGVVLHLGTRGRRLTPRDSQALLAGFGALALQVVLILTDRVPPLPLTLMDAEVRVGMEEELVELDTARELLAPVGLFVPELPHRPGEAVRMHTPIYLPDGMEAVVVHRWERHDGESWRTSDRIPLSIRGGRDLGFRTWSTKRRTVPGDWRVVVETEDGRELGRIHVRLVPADPPPATL